MSVRSSVRPWVPVNVRNQREMHVVNGERNGDTYCIVRGGGGGLNSGETKAVVVGGGLIPSIDSVKEVEKNEYSSRGTESARQQQQPQKASQRLTPHQQQPHPMQRVREMWSFAKPN